jgi:hypothetical protein
VIYRTAAAMANSIMVWILSAAWRVSHILLRWLRSTPELTIIYSNSCQSAFCQVCYRALQGGLRFRYRVQVAWLELESGSIAWARMFWLMLLAKKHRSMMEGYLLLWGMYIRCPGLLWRQKLSLSIQSVIVLVYVH